MKKRGEKKERERKGGSLASLRLTSRVPLRFPVLRAVIISGDLVLTASPSGASTATSIFNRNDRITRATGVVIVGERASVGGCGEGCVFRSPWFWW